MARRSVLFSPGDQPDMMRKSPGTGADTVVFDLEDAVVPGRKAEAREAVNEVLTDPAFDPDCEVCVRVNPTLEQAEADLETVLDGAPRIDSIMVPKVGAAADAREMDELVRTHGNDLPLLTLCESAAGVLHAEEIAATPAVDALILGAEDLTADIGATRTEAGTEVSYARQHVVLAAAAADVDAIDTVSTDFEDADRLAEATAEANRLGFDGKIAIHPSQVALINEGSTPDEADVEWAEKVLAARDEAEAAGRGVFRVDDQMIDSPLIARAERILERYRAADRQ
jgi:citrate lyase subunit beta/citryl-CoA lyase